MPYSIYLDHIKYKLSLNLEMFLNFSVFKQQALFTLTFSNVFYT